MNEKPSAFVLNEEYLDAILGSIDASVVATDENFFVRYWNKKAEQLFGYSASETIGHRAGNFLSFIYLNGSREEARQVLVREGKWKDQLHFKNQDDQVLLLDVSVSAVRNEKGESLGFVAVHRDITELDRTKANLSTFLSVISSVDDYFFVVDKELRIVWIDEKSNENFRQTYGVSYRQGDSLVGKMPPERKVPVHEALQKALNGEKNTYEASIETIGGQIKWIQAYYFPVKDSRGFIISACGLVRDITARKQVEEVNELLCKSRQLFETFMENSPLMAWITDEKGIIRYLNPAYLATYQLEKTAIGRPLTKIFPDKMAAAVRQNDLIVLKTRQLLRTVEKANTPDGEEHVYQVVKFPIEMDCQVFVGGWAIDITEEMELRKSLNDSLEKLQASEKDLRFSLEKEQQLNDMKSRFVSMASHEFRTPLSTILSSTYLLERYTITEQQANRMKHAAKIKESIEHMNALLEDFLSISKLEEGKFAVEMQNVDLKKLIRETITTCHPFQKQGQEILLKYDGYENVTTDRKLLENVIINLLNNALKFSGENKKIEIKAEISNEGTRIEIKDQGIGISKADQEHLFETFFRGKNAQNIQGTGLGLHIARRYLQLLRGNIELKSEIGIGTTVEVFLPCL